MPDKTDKKQRKFQKGKSGNPYGRPKGMRNKATILAEALLQTKLLMPLSRSTAVMR